MFFLSSPGLRAKWGSLRSELWDLWEAGGGLLSSLLGLGLLGWCGERFLDLPMAKGLLECRRRIGLLGSRWPGGLLDILRGGKGLLERRRPGLLERGWRGGLRENLCRGESRWVLRGGLGLWDIRRGGGLLLEYLRPWGLRDNCLWGLLDSLR